MTMLTKEDILRGLRKIDEKAKEAGLVVDIAIYGGAALALAFDLRDSTRDVDVVVRQNHDFIRKVSADIADDEGWPDDWLNDGVKGFISSSEAMNKMELFNAAPEQGGIRIYTPTPEYLFAMKCMAMRPEGIDGSHDISDIEALADEANITDADAALSLIEGFYPSSRIPPKVRFGVEEIMDRIAIRHEEEEKARRRDDIGYGG